MYSNGIDAARKHHPRAAPSTPDRPTYRRHASSRALAIRRKTHRRRKDSPPGTHPNSPRNATAAASREATASTHSTKLGWGVGGLRLPCVYMAELWNLFPANAV